MTKFSRLVSRALWQWRLWRMRRQDAADIRAGVIRLHNARAKHKPTRSILAEQHEVRLANLRAQFGGVEMRASDQSSPKRG